MPLRSGQNRMRSSRLSSVTGPKRTSSTRDQAETLSRKPPRAVSSAASEGAAQLLTGQSDPEAATRDLAGRGTVLAVVTAGERGAFWSEGYDVGHSPAVRVDALDTLAAGDVFHAGFALGLVEGRPLPEILRFAATAAAIKCTRFGGRLGCPTRAEVEAFGA